MSLREGAIVNNLDSALSEIRGILTKTANEIVSELEQRNKFKPESSEHKFKLTNRNGFSQGILPKPNNPKSNDLRNYVWITVEDINDNTKLWWLCLFYSDIDRGENPSGNSGNPHTQFGRFQFWKDVNNNDGKCDSPHKLIDKKGNDIELLFCGSKAYDPAQAIYNNTYDCKTLVDKFLGFLTDSL